MGHWFDFGSVLPPADTLVRLRRYPEDTPGFFGIFDVPSGTATSSVGNGIFFIIPWAFLTHWTALNGTPGVWPVIPAASVHWRDPFWSPPTDGQHVWVRRFDTDCAPVKCNYSYLSNAYVLADEGWQLPWYLVWKWKHRA